MIFQEIVKEYRDIITRNARKICEDGDLLPYYKERDDLLTKILIAYEGNENEQREKYLFYNDLQIIFGDGRIIGQREAGLYLD